MSIVEDINEILGINETYKAPEKLMEIMYLDKNERDKKLMEFLEVWNHDLSRDGFHEYFEFEHADRKVKKQDFTPNEVGLLLAKLSGGNNGMIYDCCAGTGGLVIQHWQKERIKKGPFMYNPSDYLYVCEDLSDRSIPFLIVNLCIRGMNGIVIHCDVLTRNAYGVFLIQNVGNDILGFSNFNVLPYTDEVAEYFKIKFVEKRYKSHIENEVRRNLND